MSVSAREVAAALRERLSGMPTKKLHKLLYYCQGHHLAFFGQPLFVETISAWDMGPVVAALWHEEKGGQPRADSSHLGEAELNTVGYVVSRYGKLTGSDLERLSHSEEPWQKADQRRGPKESVRIEPEWIRDYFTSVADRERLALDPAELRAFLAGAEERRREPAHFDDLEALRARLSG